MGGIHYPEKKIIPKKKLSHLYPAYFFNPAHLSYPALSIPPIYPIPPFSSCPFKYSRQLINPLVLRGLEIKIHKLADVLMSREKPLFLPFVALLETFPTLKTAIFLFSRQ